MDEVDIETLSNNAESILYYSCCILWSESGYKDDVVSVLGKMLARLSSQFLPHAPQILTLLSGIKNYCKFKDLTINNKRPNLKNLSRELNLSRVSNMNGFT